MVDIEKLTPEFEKLNPGIKVVYDTLEREQRALADRDRHHDPRQRVQRGDDLELRDADLGEERLARQPHAAADGGQELRHQRSAQADPRMRSRYKGGLYSVPFYGESSMVYYRKSLFKAAGLDDAAASDLEADRGDRGEAQRPSSTAGICLRGQDGWGENLAALDTVINTGGGSWFNSFVAAAADLARRRGRDELLRQPGPQGRRAGRVATTASPSARRCTARARRRCGTTRPSRRA